MHSAWPAITRIFAIATFLAGSIFAQTAITSVADFRSCLNNGYNRQEPLAIGSGLLHQAIPITCLLGANLPRATMLSRQQYPLMSTGPLLPEHYPLIITAPPCPESRQEVP